MSLQSFALFAIALALSLVFAWVRSTREDRRDISEISPNEALEQDGIYAFFQLAILILCISGAFCFGPFAWYIKVLLAIFSITLLAIYLPTWAKQAIRLIAEKVYGYAVNG